MIRALLPISKILPLQTLINISGLSCFFPFYHTIGYGKDLPHLNKLYPIITPEQFSDDLEILLKYYNPISPEELLKGDFSKPAMLISFDDGLSGVKEYAHPILKKKGIPYVVFVNPSFIDNTELMFRCKQSLLINHLIHSGIYEILVESDEISLKNYNPELSTLDALALKTEFSFGDFLSDHRPYLTTQDLIDMQKDGVHIGSHSMNHPLYENIPLDEQINQTIESIKWVRDKLQCKLGLFAFPFTDHGVSKEFMDWLMSNQNIDMSFGSAGLKLNAYSRHFQRYGMEVKNGKLTERLKSEYISFQAKRIIGKDQVVYR